MIDEICLHFRGIASWPSRAWLRVTGGDALAFLQGQFTHELRPDRAPPVQYGLWLNQKGRVVADSTIIREAPDVWWVVSEECPAAEIVARLEPYIIADDVVIDDQTTEWVHWLLAGEEGARWLKDRGVEPPMSGTWQPLGRGIVTVGRLPGSSWILHLPKGDPAAPEATTLTPAAVERVRISAGIPSVPRDVGPMDLPAESGLEATAVSFTKGCYLGQEVVARLNALGRVRRRLMRVSAAGGAVPGAGQPLHQEGRRVGELRSAIELASGGWIGLAMMTLLGLAVDQPLALTPDGPADVRVETNPQP